MEYTVKYERREFIRRSPTKRQGFGSWETVPLYRTPRRVRVLLTAKQGRFVTFVQVGYVVAHKRRLGIYRVVCLDLLTRQWRAGIWQATDRAYGIIAAQVGTCVQLIKQHGTRAYTKTYTDCSPASVRRLERAAQQAGIPIL